MHSVQAGQQEVERWTSLVSIKCNLDYSVSQSIFMCVLNSIEQFFFLATVNQSIFVCVLNSIKQLFLDIVNQSIFVSV